MRGGEVYPIDYANACPDIEITSLHYHFPWAMRWSSGRRLLHGGSAASGDARRPLPWFAVADRDDLSYGEKLRTYRSLADAHLEVERYRDFCDSRLRHMDELVPGYVESAESDGLLVDTVCSTFPPHEHEHFVDHYRGPLGWWAHDERGRLG